MKFKYWALKAALALGVAIPAIAQEKPLLIEGKEQLFQRVIMRETTKALDQPDGAKVQALRPLQPLYVYARDDGWLQVGHSETGGDLFWIPEKSAVEWNQNIVATIEPSENLDRLLFFADFDELYDTVLSENPRQFAQTLREEAERAEANKTVSDKIVALGPRQAVDQRQNLYVMPILSAVEDLFDNGAYVNMLEVAVARAEPEGTGRNHTPTSMVPEDYKAAIVFVVDTTTSMEPFIHGTRDALEAVYEEVRAKGVEDRVSFGLVGYRDNLAAAPGLGYLAKTFVNLRDGHNPQRFLSAIAEMGEADSTSRNFREDSYAGIEYALNSMDWRPFSAKYIVLVTDASPREADDDLSATGLSATGLNRIARERLGAIISVMHLRTPNGAKDHDRAERAYRALTRQPNLPPLYFPINGGDAKAYRNTAQQIGELITDQVFAFSGEAEGEEFEDFGGSDHETPMSALASAGRTVKLAYLGSKNNAKAPEVFEAYVADRDFARTGLKPLSIRLLISKQELSNLDEALRLIIEQAEENVISPDKFFTQVLGAAADMSRKPDSVSRRSDPSLAEAVSIAEYIEDLPYKSRIMSVTEDEWVRMSISEQQVIVNDLYDKVERYRRYNAATDQWVDYLGQGAKAQNLLYPMVLNDLP